MLAFSVINYEKNKHSGVIDLSIKLINLSEHWLSMSPVFDNFLIKPHNLCFLFATAHTTLSELYQWQCGYSQQSYTLLFEMRNFAIHFLFAVIVGILGVSGDKWSKKNTDRNVIGNMNEIIEKTESLTGSAGHLKFTGAGKWHRIFSQAFFRGSFTARSMVEISIALNCQVGQLLLKI